VFAITEIGGSELGVGWSLHKLDRDAAADHGRSPLQA